MSLLRGHDERALRKWPTLLLSADPGPDRLLAAVRLYNPKARAKTDEITKIATEESGFVASTDSQKLENGKVKGTVTLRCPPEPLPSPPAAIPLWRRPMR